MARDDRPLSPDLQIYRPQLTSVLSITHRLTGVALSVGSPLLVCWLIAAAAGPSAYSALHGLSRLMARARPAVRVDVLPLFPPLQRHSASLLGRWLRFRSPDDLRLRLGSGGHQYRPYPDGLDHQLRYEGVESMAAKQVRSSFDRTQGLGSAREGVGHWWMQRVTAVALVPLTLWFAASLIARARDDYGAFHPVAPHAVDHRADGAVADRTFLSHGARSSGGG